MGSRTGTNSFRPCSQIGLPRKKFRGWRDLHPSVASASLQSAAGRPGSAGQHLRDVVVKNKHDDRHQKHEAQLEDRFAHGLAQLPPHRHLDEQQ